MGNSDLNFLESLFRLLIISDIMDLCMWKEAMNACSDRKSFREKSRSSPTLPGRDHHRLNTGREESWETIKYEIGLRD